MIPKTTTYKQFKEKKAREEAAAAAVTPVAPGQTTIQNGFGSTVSADNLNGRSEHSSNIESNGVLSTLQRPLPVNGSPIADRTLNSSVHGHPLQTVRDDVEMMDEASP